MVRQFGVSVGMLVAGLAWGQIAPRTNEIAPGRVNELTRMQDTKPATPVTLPPEPTNPGPYPYPVQTVYPSVGYIGYGYGNWYNPYRWRESSQPVQVSQTQNVNVAAAGPSYPMAAPTPPTELDYAMEAMRSERTAVAIDHFIEYLKDHPTDYVALRLSALMYLEEKQPAEAATRIVSAYKHMPELARRPINAAELQISSARLRELVVKASKYAQRTKTGSSWLVMAVLTQAEGRTEVAINNLKKAAAAGLDQDIVTALMNTLAPGQNEQVPAAEAAQPREAKSQTETANPAK
jgi:hypothetical protein